MIKIFIIGLSLFLFHENATVCDCDGQRPALDSIFKYSSFVFVGEVKSITPKISYVDQEMPFLTFHGVEFSTLEMLKGDSSRRFVVAIENSDCGQKFFKGHRYLVYSLYDTAQKTFRVENICSVLCSDINTNDGAMDLSSIRQLSKLK